MDDVTNISALSDSFTSWSIDYLKVSKLSEIAAKLAYYNYEWRYITLVVFNTINFIGVGRFVKQYEKAVFVQRGVIVPTVFRGAIMQNVLYGENTTDVIEMLHLIKKFEYNNIGKYIIVCVSQYKDCNENKIFKTCSALDIVNVIFLRSSYDTEIINPLVFTYYPILPGKCRNSHPVELNIIPECLQDKCFKNAYPEKFENFYGCEVTVSTFEQNPLMFFHPKTNETRGEDGDLLMLLMRALNATLRVTIPTHKGWGTLMNGTWTGSLGDVYYGKANFSMTSAPLTFTRFSNFQISVSYGAMDIIWVTGWPPLKSKWGKIITPLSSGVRYIMVLMFIIIALVHIISKSKKWNGIRKVLKIAPPKSNPLFYSWLICLGNPILKLPTKPALLTVVYLWIWFTLIVRNIYQAALISSLKNDSYDVSIRTIGDVIATDKKFGGAVSLKEYYEGNADIYNNYIEITMDHVTGLLDGISNGTYDFVAALNIEAVLKYLGYFNGAHKLYILPEKIISSPTVIYYKKYSPLAPPLDKLLIKTMETGITDRLYRRYMQESKKLFNQYETDIPMSLNIEHFAGTFLTLCVCWLFCLITFVCEINYHKNTYTFK